MEHAGDGVADAGSRASVIAAMPSPTPARATGDNSHGCEGRPHQRKEKQRKKARIPMVGRVLAKECAALRKGKGTKESA